MKKLIFISLLMAGCTKKDIQPVKQKPVFVQVVAVGIDTTYSQIIEAR